MFKEKSTKKRISSNNPVKDNSTLDARHQQKLSDLSKHYGSLESLVKERNELSRNLETCQDHIRQLKESGHIDTPVYDAAWSSNIFMQDHCVELGNMISHLQAATDEIEYYENTGRILFKYYDVIEHQDKNSVNTEPTKVVMAVSKTSRKKHVAPPTRSILDAFAGIASNQEPVNTTQVNKSVLVDEYISKIDPSYLQPTGDEGMGQCPLCRTPLVCIQHEGVMICSECGFQDMLLIEQNRPLLRQVTKESTASYKRINHFREWCSQMQGKESTDIPESVFEQILQEIKKEKIVDKKKITYTKMREILKRLRVNKYYEHIVYIINRINGNTTPPPHFTPELEDKLCSMFKEIQGPFLNAVMHTAKERKNFLSYAYCLHQFFRILNLPEYLKCTTLLKSREKLYVQDQIFKSICKELNWPFHPTL
jgi:hypothetical protein